MIEKLDIHNVIEIQKIRQMLIRHPDLLALFEVLLIIINERINSKRIDL
tara:strand:+ start:192 stop:338 length:147 start_codon:yes stop_codon:yes gene_type:complete